MSIQVTNTSSHIIHVGLFSLQPGVNVVDESFKIAANTSDYLRDFVAQFTDFIPKSLDITTLNVANASKVIAEEADIEALERFKEAEDALEKPRQTVLKALNDRITELSAEPLLEIESVTTVED